MSFLRTHKYGLALTALLLFFVLAKLPHIGTPYFWDELGVYAPGALKMKDNGTIGLLPSSLEPLYSRGHPLLFVFSQAAWFHIFGDDVISGHAFSILTGALTLLIFYLCAANLFNKSIALIASLALAVQPIFFAGAGVVLPEMMLALFTIPAVWGIIQNRWGVYALAASLAMMTKESAIVIPPLALLVLLFDAVREKDFFSLSRFKKLISAVTPLLVFGIFLIIQKKQNGWYFFPLHVGYLRLDKTLFEQGWYIFRDVALKQGRWVFTLFTVWGLFRSFTGNDFSPWTKRVLYVSVIFVFACILFAGLNFYLLRYLIYAVPFLVLTGVASAAVFLRMLPAKSGLPAAFFLTVLATVLAIFNMDRKSFNDTADMSYIHLAKMEKEAVRWLEQQPWKDSVIEANFPVFQALEDPRYGYLKGKPLNISVNYERSAPYGIFYHMKKDEVFAWNYKPYTVIKEYGSCLGFITIVQFKQNNP